MGFNFSRPQYGYRERLRPAEYFRVCDPSDCFCGGPTHYRQRHVAVHRLPGGQEVYRDPMDMLDAILGGGGFGRPHPLMSMYGHGHPGLIPGLPPSMPMGFGGAGLPAGPGNIASFGGLGNITGLPSLGNFNGPSGAMPGLGNVLSLGNIANIPGLGSLSHGGWPPEWKDPREWTTRDYDRLGEIMNEYLNRQRGRNMFPGVDLGLGGFGQTLPFQSLMGMPWDTSSRKSHRHKPTYSDLDQLRDQMFAYAQQAKEHMQAVNDCLYGSEREQREERYRDRQKKMMEEILKGLLNAGRNLDTFSLGQQPTQALPGAGYPINPMMGMAGYTGSNPLAGMQNMYPAGMQNMYPGGVDPMAFGGMEGLAQRAGMQRPRRGMRGLGFNDGFDGGAYEELGGRRSRRRRGFEEGDDDVMDMGDGRRSPNGPRHPQRPRPGRDGASFDEAARSQPNTARWGVYEPDRAGENLRYEASPRPQTDPRQQGQWPAPAFDGAYAPPRFERQGPPIDRREGGQMHVSFQDQHTAAASGDDRDRRPQ